MAPKPDQTPDDEEPAVPDLSGNDRFNASTDDLILIPGDEPDEPEPPVPADFEEGNAETAEAEFLAWAARPR